MMLASSLTENVERQKGAFRFFTRGSSKVLFLAVFIAATVVASSKVIVSTTRIFSAKAQEVFC